MMSNQDRHAAPSTHNRRRFLRSAGVAVAMPALASLTPRAALAAEATGGRSPVRYAFLSIPNGVQNDYWFPSMSDGGLKLSRTLAPLESLRENLQVVTGLKHQNATSGSDGPGDHARAGATYLTGARARKTGGKNIHLGVSVDQVIAKHLRNQTRLPSLELSCDAVRNSGACDSGYACAYQYNISWSSPTTPVAAEVNPRHVFERLFGAGSPEERRKNLAERQASHRSVLDFVLQETRDVRRRLSAAEHVKIDQYLQAVRDVERRLEAAERFSAANPDQETPRGIPKGYGDHMDAMYDLLALALQTNSTRVATLLLAHDGSNRSFPTLDIAEGHHNLTHMPPKQAALKVADIDRYYAEHFARFLQKLKDAQDLDGRSVLDNSVIAYGAALGDGHRHNHDNLPMVLAGGGGGALGADRIVEARNTPMSNMFVELLNLAGSSAESFGDSTGRLESIRV